MKEQENKALDVALDTLFNRYTSMMRGKEKKKEKEPPKKRQLVEGLSEEDFLNPEPKRQFVRLGERKGVSNANAR